MIYLITKPVKNKISIVFMIFCLHLTYSQDSLKINQLEDVTISKKVSKKTIRSIISKILINLKNNYETDSYNYFTKHISVKDYRDTLVNKVKPISFQIKNLTKKNVNEVFRGNYSNSCFIDVSPYFDYESQFDTTNHWLAMSIFNDSMKVIDFNFFNYISDYEYILTQDGDLRTIRFNGSSLYEGYFTYDRNYNINRIIFKNSGRNNFGTTGHSSEYKDGLEFKSNWVYNKEAMKLDFEVTEKGKLLLSSLSAFQEITNFKYTRYSTDGQRVSGDSHVKFYTTFQMNLLK
jgi:hypothetical protein